MARETPPPGRARETPPPGVATKTHPGMATETPPSVATETPPGRCASIFNVIGSTLSRHAFIFIVIMSTVPILGTGYFLVSTLLLLRRGGDPKCEYPRLEWDLWFDVFLLLIFLAGSIGVSVKAKAVQITCITLLGVTTLLIVVISWSVDIGGTFPKDAKRIDDAYRLETYAPWAHKFLLKDSGWNTYQICLMEKKICDKLDNLDFVQGGCCLPPSYCGYEEKNLTWVIPKTGRYAEDTNCVRWDNDERKLCYDCETCQAVYVNTMEYNWTGRALGPFLGAMVLFLCFALTFAEDGCENNRSRGRADNNRSV
ncbi:hypothetical protein RHMOL_Rhmol05G0060400 [Rhododendron molle]|uniref:Uncharacterized protein n=1 Tax=Rhododendron molle TaxID=49168 RepID=A0ACC0NME7_RHOML|nr:hypothetical protein RHMOL_Rhmol05G0060400 [Rhododendron molle]